MKKPVQQTKRFDILKIFLNKYFIISAAGFIILLVIFLAFLNILPYISKDANVQINKVLNPSSDGTTTAVYGIQMSDKCITKFQNFVKDHGEDYSKCLADFNFNEGSCGESNSGLSDVNVVVILDASGSMADKIYFDTKIDIAKKAVSDFLTQVPQSVNTGLIVYGHKGSSSSADKDLSCNGVEEIVKLGPNNGNNIISAINSFGPKGWTPIAGSLEFAKNVFLKNGGGGKDYLILVSDGIESCGGDPLSAVEDVEAAIPNIELDIIGFTDDDKTEKYLNKIATVGGGSYLTAIGSLGIAKAFNRELLLIKKECINVTLSQTTLDYSYNKSKNLSCWLAAYKNESDAFAAYEVKGPVDTECNSEIANALEARRNDFWYKKEALSEKNDDIYKKIKENFDNQLEALDNQ